MKWILLVVVLLVVVGVTIVILRARSKKQTVGGEVPRPVAEKKTEDLSEKISGQISNLTDLLLKMKLKKADQEVCNMVSDIVRKLMIVLPKAASGYPGSEMSWVTGRVADGYIPELVNPYVDLSQSGRSEKKEALIGTLKDIDGKLSEIDSSLDAGDALKFESQVAYLKKMLSTASIEAI